MNKQSSVVQTRIDPSIKDEAKKDLSQMGLSVSDAMRIVLTRTATEGRVPVEIIADQASLMLSSNRKSWKPQKKNMTWITMMLRVAFTQRDSLC